MGGAGTEGSWGELPKQAHTCREDENGKLWGTGTNEVQIWRLEGGK